MSVRPPAPYPCGSCPYRLDVPSGIWSEEEYEKLPPYDREESFDQPFGLFMCHQQDGRVCAGWAGCHDMEEAIAVRFLGDIEVIEALLDYETSTPLFASGQEAADHGLRRVQDPDMKARKVMDKLVARRRLREGKMS